MTFEFYIAVAISFFISFLFLKINYRTFHQLAENSLGLLNEILSKESEDAKIELIQRKTKKLLWSLFMLIILISGSILIVCVILYGYLIFSDLKYEQLDLSSFTFILSISIGATIPFLIPSNIDNSGYSNLAQLLHRLILDNKNISLKLFKKDAKRIKRRGVSKRNDFIIISGLARSGTTSLMTSLSEVKNLKSLSYSNMPLVMSPLFWKKFYNPKNSKLKERSHKDGMSIGLDTVEALEEHFFIVKTNGDFIQDKVLIEHEISEEVYNDYLTYQQIVREDDSTLYLAKNNNFLLRYKSIRNYNKTFLMVILYRDPLSHAHSLLNQHKEFCKLQKNAGFIEEYMNWLGHHEFGTNQKQFLFSNNMEIIEGDKFTIDYWLKIWINYYSYVLTLNSEELILLDYLDYCTNPTRVINKLLSKINFPTIVKELKSFSNNRKSEGEYTIGLYENATTIYDKLSSLSQENK